MSDTTVVMPIAGDRSSNIDWGSIIGGALIATALSFVLFAFGSAAGFMSVSPYSWNNPSTTTLTIIGVAWFSVAMIFSFLAGGYFAGRYRRPVGDTFSKDETEARDGAHGLLVWALSMLLGVSLAAMAAAGAARTAASAAGGAATIAAQNVPRDRMGGVLDTMLRPAGDAANPVGVENPRAEVARIMTGNALTRGEITNDDRDYIARVVAAEARIPQDEARRRVDAGIEQGKQAADAARKVTAALAFLIGALSIIAAGAAYWAATGGGRARDDAARVDAARRPL